MHTYPANEERISEVERGQSCEAVVPLPIGQSLSVGESVLFALYRSRAGQPPCYVKGGDSVLVSLISVTDLGAIDPSTGQGLVRLVWEPLGQRSPLNEATSRASKPRGSRGRL